MNKSISIAIIILLLLSLLDACTYEDPVIKSLPEYKSKDSYLSEGFQDYTDYAKYTFDNIETDDLNESGYFKEATEADVSEILAYIKNFEGWVDLEDGEVEENYDFDKTIVTVGDYFYIDTKYGQPIGTTTYGKFDDYNVYFFDTDSQILYYFHNNI